MRANHHFDEGDIPQDNHLEPEDDIVSDFFSGLKLDKNLTCNETAQSLPDTPLLSAYLNYACKEQKAITKHLTKFMVPKHQKVCAIKHHYQKDRRYTF